MKSFKLRNLIILTNFFGSWIWGNLVFKDFYIIIIFEEFIEIQDKRKKNRIINFFSLKSFEIQLKSVQN